MAFLLQARLDGDGMNVKDIVFAIELIGTIAIYIILKITLGLAYAELFMIITYSLVLLGLIDATQKLVQNDIANDDKNAKNEDKDKSNEAKDVDKDDKDDKDYKEKN